MLPNLIVPEECVPGPFGLCLPCCVAPAAPTESAHFDFSLNPFSQIADASSVRSILPIKSLWYPVKTTALDMLLYYIHESIHLYLSDTLIGSSVIYVVQCQYVEILERLRLGGDGRIPFPSINDDPDVVRLLKASQYVMDCIDLNLTLIHELFAASLASVYLRYQKVVMTTQLLRVLAYNMGRPRSEKDYSLAEGFALIDVGDAPQLKAAERRATEVHNYVVQWYTNAFSKFGYNFAEMEASLTTAFAKIAETLDADDMLFLLNLASYPLNIASSHSASDTDGAEVHFSVKSEYVDILSPHMYVFDNKTAVVDRTRRLIEVITHAPALYGKKEWEIYLSISLPGYVTRKSYGGQLATAISNLWEQEGNETTIPDLYRDVGRAYYELFVGASHLCGIFPVLPVFHEDGWRFKKDKPALARHFQFIVMLEVLRQAVFTGHGLVCLCQEDAKVKGDCLVREVFEECWQMLVYDQGAGKEGMPVWVKPKCV